jgi:hypothetical protein
MSGWITFWTWVYIIGCPLGALMALIILPFGVRDLVRLYRLLNAQAPSNDDAGSNGESPTP